MIYVSLGTPSSASTWVYNILKAILARRAVAHVSYQCETLGDMLRHDAAGARAHVWKAHNLEAPLLRMLALSEVPLVVSIRDPRDAVASLTARFGANPVDCAQQVVRSIASVFSAVGACPGALVLEYESGFPEHVETVRAIAGRMALDLAAADLESIRAAFTLDQVRAFTRRMFALPPRRLVLSGNDLVDRDTQFHHTHVSDAAVGKWRAVLPPDLHDAIETLFEPLVGMAFFEPGMTLTFPPALFHGLANPGLLPRADPRRTEFCVLDRIFLGRGTWAVDLACTGGGGARNLRVVQGGEIRADQPLASDGTASLGFTFVNQLHDTAIQAFLAFADEPRFDDAAAPQAVMRATFMAPL